MGSRGATIKKDVDTRQLLKSNSSMVGDAVVATVGDCVGDGLVGPSVHVTASGKQPRGFKHAVVDVDSGSDMLM